MSRRPGVLGRPVGLAGLPTRGDAGFSLVEVLVVMAILAILAGIAVAVLLSQRAPARASAVKEDLRNLALAVESASVSSGDYRRAFRANLTAGSALVTDGVANRTNLLAPFRGSGRVSILLGRTSPTSNVGSLSKTQFCLVANHLDVGTGMWWVYSKRRGGLLANPYTTQSLARAAC